ncbi:restriction endonuclease subunit S, partial [Shewanella baltica]|uniref:restriction endonuclease subunit S n=1 Tax=Shewanella baltica TaxID=62322 RepID=UPI0039B0652E
TIAITCRGNTCGTINRIPAKTYITGNSMALDDVEDKIITQDYLYHSLTHRSVSDAISGSAQPQITGNSLKQVRFPLAPLLEQQKIAAILTSVDDVIEKTQAQIDKLKDLKSGMMQELLTKGVGVDGKPHTEFKDSPVGRIPKMWKMAPLSNVCELQVGYAFKSTWFVDAGIKLLRGDNVGFGTATWERTKYLSKHEANNYQDYQLSRGDIIIGMDRTFTKSGVKITKLSIEDTPSLLVQRVGRFLPKSTCDDDFLWQLLRSSQYLDALKGQEKGMDIPHLSKSEILTPYVVIPPLEEQKIIARTLRSVDDMIERNSKKLISNNLLKKALMQDLLTGKVRVTID